MFKKHMDIHRCYLEDGCVTSRHFGSEFLGHVRADDLLLDSTALPTHNNENIFCLEFRVK